MKRFSIVSRSLSLGLVCLCVANAALANAPEANFWRNRQRTLVAGAVAQAATENKPIQLANLPVSLPGSLGRLNSFSAPAISESVQVKNLCGRISNPEFQRISSIVSSIPSAFGSVRKISVPRNGTVKTIIVHIDDVHQNAEAQANIGQTLQQLITDKKIDLVALEGAFEPIDLAAFRNYPRPFTIRKVADYLLRENQISGPIHATLTTPSEIPPVIGVDDEQKYRANVRAYKESRRVIAAAKKIQHTREQDLFARKSTIFHRDLLAFDNQVEAYQHGQISLKNYLQLLGRETDRSVDLQRFIEALRMEESLDVARVEAERSRLLSHLLEKIHHEERAHLIDLSVAYRLNQIRQTDFYSALQQICEKNGLHLSSYPAMDNYIRYLLLADNVDAEKIFSEVKKLETQTYNRLASSNAEHELVDELLLARLTKKLLDFSLTPEEWTDYAQRQNKSEPMIKPFEDFYRAAQARDRAMSAHLESAIKAEKKTVAVLVTGGFHSSGMDARLQQQGVTVISFTPRITKVESPNGASAYLSVFVQDKAPLQKLFEGEKLFLAVSPFSRSEQKIGFQQKALLFEEASDAAPLTRQGEILHRLQTDARFHVVTEDQGQDQATEEISSANGSLKLRMNLTPQKGIKSQTVIASEPSWKMALRSVRLSSVPLSFVFLAILAIGAMNAVGLSSENPANFNVDLLGPTAAGPVVSVGAKVILMIVGIGLTGMVLWGPDVPAAGGHTPNATPTINPSDILSRDWPYDNDIYSNEEDHYPLDLKYMLDWSHMSPIVISTIMTMIARQLAIPISKLSMRGFKGGSFALIQRVTANGKEYILEIPLIRDPERNTLKSRVQVIRNNHIYFNAYRRQGLTRFLPESLLYNETFGIPYALHSYFQGYDELSFDNGTLRTWTTNTGVLRVHNFEGSERANILAEMIAAIVYHYDSQNQRTLTDVYVNNGDFIYRRNPDGSPNIKLITIRAIKDHVSVEQFLVSLIQFATNEQMISDENKFTPRQVSTFAPIIPVLISNPSVAFHGLLRGLTYRYRDMEKMSDAEALAHAKKEAKNWVERLERDVRGQKYKPWIDQFKNFIDGNGEFPLAFGNDPREGEPVLEVFRTHLNQIQAYLQNDSSDPEIKKSVQSLLPYLMSRLNLLEQKNRIALLATIGTIIIGAAVVAGYHYGSGLELHSLSGFFAHPPMDLVYQTLLVSVGLGLIGVTTGGGESKNKSAPTVWRELSFSAADPDDISRGWIKSAFLRGDGAAVFCEQRDPTHRLYLVKSQDLADRTLFTLMTELGTQVGVLQFIYDSEQQTLKVQNLDLAPTYRDKSVARLLLEWSYQQAIKKYPHSQYPLQLHLIQNWAIVNLAVKIFRLNQLEFFDPFASQWHPASALSDDFIQVVSPLFLTNDNDNGYKLHGAMEIRNEGENLVVQWDDSRIKAAADGLHLKAYKTDSSERLRIQPAVRFDIRVRANGSNPARQNLTGSVNIALLATIAGTLLISVGVLSLYPNELHNFLHLISGFFSHLFLASPLSVGEVGFAAAGLWFWPILRSPQDEGGGQGKREDVTPSSASASHELRTCVLKNMGHLTNRNLAVIRTAVDLFGEKPKAAGELSRTYEEFRQTWITEGSPARIEKSIDQLRTVIDGIAPQFPGIEERFPELDVIELQRSADVLKGALVILWELAKNPNSKETMREIITPDVGVNLIRATLASTDKALSMMKRQTPIEFRINFEEVLSRSDFRRETILFVSIGLMLHVLRKVPEKGGISLVVRNGPNQSLEFVCKSHLKSVPDSTILNILKDFTRPYHGDIKVEQRKVDEFIEWTSQLTLYPETKTVNHDNRHLTGFGSIAVMTTIAGVSFIAAIVVALHHYGINHILQSITVFLAHPSMAGPDASVMAVAVAGLWFLPSIRYSADSSEGNTRRSPQRWGNAFWKQHLPKVEQRESTTLDNVASSLVEMASLKAQANGQNSEQIVREFFSGSAVDIGLGNIDSPRRYTNALLKHPRVADDWRALVADPRFPAILKKQVDAKLKQGLSSDQALELVNALYTFGLPIEATQNLSVDVALRIRSNKDVLKAQRMAEQSQALQSITLLADSAQQADELNKLIVTWNFSKPIKAVNAEGLFIGQKLILKKLRSYLPSFLTPNLSNLLFVSFTPLYVDDSDVEADSELAAVRMIVLNELLQGTVISLRDGALINKLAQILITSKQA